MHVRIPVRFALFLTVCRFRARWSVFDHVLGFTLLWHDDDSQ